MKAMILAAGLGTRLRPLTDNIPKALVELNGRTLLEITIERLKSFGITEIIVNVHHHAEKIAAFVNSKNNFGLRIELSREDDLLLDTGGGLKKAASFFQEENSAEPFLLHNVDVLSTIDFRQMLAAHKKSSALATLAVQQRPSSRQLLFDDNGLLCGRRINNTDTLLSSVNSARRGLRTRRTSRPASHEQSPRRGPQAPPTRHCSPSTRLLRYPRHLSTLSPAHYRIRRLLHHRHLSPPRQSQRKNLRLPRRLLLLARPRPPRRSPTSGSGPRKERSGVIRHLARRNLCI